MKAYGGVDVEIHVFLTSALIGEWSASRPGRFAPGIHWIGGWVGPGIGLDDVKKTKILPLPALELRPLVRRTRSQSPYGLREQYILTFEQATYITIIHAASCITNLTLGIKHEEVNMQAEHCWLFRPESKPPSVLYYYANLGHFPTEIHP
jgi:hypothetical protein